MEEVLTRFPHLGENILQKLDSKSLIECKEVNRTFKNFMRAEKSSYLRVIQWYTNCSESLMRKIVEKSGAAIIIASILHEIFGNFTRGTKQHHKNLQKSKITPLHLAAECGQLGAYYLIMEKVLNNNPYADAINCIYTRIEKLHGFREATPLHLAAKNGNLAICKLILQNVFDKNPTGAKPVDKNATIRIAAKSLMDQWTPLHLAAEAGHFSICELLINNISKKNPEDQTGWTPLHSAVQNGHLRVVKLILSSLSAGHVRNTIDMYGNTPLKLATQYHHKQIRTAILEYISDAEAMKINWLKDIHFQIDLHETLRYDFDSQSWIQEGKDFNRLDEKENMDKEDKVLRLLQEVDFETLEANGDQSHRKMQKSEEARINKRTFEGDSSASIPAKIWRYW